MRQLLITTAAAFFLVGCGPSDIHQAVIKGDVKSIKSFLDSGVNVNTKKKYNKTPLALAAEVQNDFNYYRFRGGNPIELSHNNHKEIVERLENKNIGWAYADQSIFNPKLHNLMGLRKQIIKRPVITTVEVLVKPVSSKNDMFFTGFVHKPYPPIYLELSRNAGFNSATVIRGTEGGIIPSLRQTGKVHFYHSADKQDESYEVFPDDLGIIQSSRAVDIPNEITRKNTKDKIESKVNATDIAKETIKLGIDALSGNDGPMLSCIQLGAAIILQRSTGNELSDCSKEVLQVIKTGAALKRIKK